MAAEEWNEAWSASDYQWPVTSIPDPAIVEQLGKRVAAIGGRAIKEVHADRSVVMDFPGGATPGMRIRKQVPRAECRRRGQIMLIDALKVCVVCDAVNLWPNMTI